jgi:hypothetical protein
VWKFKVDAVARNIIDRYDQHPDDQYDVRGVTVTLKPGAAPVGENRRPGRIHYYRPGSKEAKKAAARSKAIKEGLASVGDSIALRALPT